MSKTIEVKKWKEKVLDREGKEIEIEVTLLNALTILINNKDQNKMPKGLDGFRLFHRLSKSFEDADKSGILKLDDVDYKFLVDTINGEIPGQWGRNPEIVLVIDEFLNIK